MTHDRHDLTAGLTFLMAVACGALVANLYYAQVLIDQIGPDIHLSPWLAGLIVTLTQLGYGLGLALIVPLSDLVENRRLVVISTLGAAVGCVAIALSRNAATFLIASLLAGTCSVGAQVLVPLTAHFSSVERQGRSVGRVMSGLLAGIMLARPVASFIGGVAGWRAVFWLAGGIALVIAAALTFMLPQRTPDAGKHYGQLLASTLGQLGRFKQLRLRAVYQGLLFAAFNLFWTAAPLVLIRQFYASHVQVALFALAGAGGALIAPVAGHLADHGKARAATITAMATLAISFIASGFVVAAGMVIAFAVTAVLIDGAVQLNQVSGQRILFALDPQARGRINAAYMSVNFLVGASGSFLGSAAYAYGGWWLAAGIGAAIGVVPLAIFALFDRKA
jgi:predicted MFS family arabinose efflux permease